MRLLDVARNQFAHKVEKNMALLSEPSAEQLIVDVLVSLCHVDGWLP
jgi:hypothetical protein